MVEVDYLHGTPLESSALSTSYANKTSSMPLEHTLGMSLKATFTTVPIPAENLTQGVNNTPANT
jgi:hypothetical protein